MNKKLFGALMLVIIILAGGSWWYFNKSSSSRINEIISQEPKNSVEQDAKTRTFSESGALVITDDDAIALSKSENKEIKWSKFTVVTDTANVQYGGEFNLIDAKVVFTPNIPCDHNCPSEITVYELQGVNPERFVVYRGSITGNAASANPGITSYLDTQFGKDDKNVYYQNKVIEGADPNTFELYADAYGGATEYSRDKTHVFFKSEIVEGVNPETYKQSI